MLLLAWQQVHHELTEAQQKQFLENINVEQILTYPKDVIIDLLPKHRKLNSLRAALWHEVMEESAFDESLGDRAAWSFEDDGSDESEDGSWF